jgi:chitinase
MFASPTFTPTTNNTSKMRPDQIPLGYYTHINFAFSLINPTSHRLVPMDDTTGKLYREVSDLKARQPQLQVWLAIGGWAMNDPGIYRTVFSDIAASTSAQDEFFESLVTFLVANNFDGVDIDWEYPVADDRGGKPQDFKNYVTFLGRLRARLNNLGRPMGMTLTLPASYWYLRGFDIVNLEQHVDWFNVMTYDIRESPLLLSLQSPIPPLTRLQTACGTRLSNRWGHMLAHTPTSPR